MLGVYEGLGAPTVRYVVCPRLGWKVGVGFIIILVVIVNTTALYVQARWGRWQGVCYVSFFACLYVFPERFILELYSTTSIC